MKNLVVLVLALAFIAVVACTQRKPDGSIVIDETHSSTMTLNPRLEIIDSCEYLFYDRGVTHKGNCKFCKERRQKEFYKMVDVLFNTEEQWTKED